MNQITETPREWTTFRGMSAEPQELDQQHLSNIYWFYAILHSDQLLWVLQILADKYNGQLLPYQPHIEFTQEILMLETNGNLNWVPMHEGDLIRTGVITHNGAIVGGLALPLKPGDYERYKTTKKAI